MDSLVEPLHAWILFVVLMVTFVSYPLIRPKSSNEKIEAPIIGPERSWVARWKFLSEASRSVKEGNEKVNVSRQRAEPG